MAKDDIQIVLLQIGYPRLTQKTGSSVFCKDPLWAHRWGFSCRVLYELHLAKSAKKIFCTARHRDLQSVSFDLSVEGDRGPYYKYCTRWWAVCGPSWDFGHGGGWGGGMLFPFYSSESGNPKRLNDNQDSNFSMNTGILTLCWSENFTAKGSSKTLSYTWDTFIWGKSISEVVQSSSNWIKSLLVCPSCKSHSSDEVPKLKPQDMVI